MGELEATANAHFVTTPSQTPPPFKFRHFASQDTKTATMPKEKTTRKGADKSAGGKRKRDPNMPKRGLSAYMFFANDQRDKVREENPGIKFGEVGKILGEKWKGLNDKQKAPYEAKAAADKNVTRRSRLSPSRLLSLHASKCLLALASCASRSTVSCIFTRAGRVGERVSRYGWRGVLWAQ